MLKPLTLLATVFAIGASPGVARGQTAQPWLDGRGQTAIGIRAGDLELHPGVAGEAGYDSNFFQGSGTDDGVVSEPLAPTARVRVTPSISVNTIRTSTRAGAAPPPRFDLSGKLVGRLDQLWALKGDFDDRGTSSRTLIDGDLSGILNILPQRPWGGSINLLGARVAQPTNDPGILGDGLGRWVAGGGAELRWRPGGGSLDWSLGYGVRYTDYDDKSFGLDVLEQTVETKGRWLFLPRTSLLYQGQVKFVNYTLADTDHYASTPVSALIGINGLLTSKLALTLLGGWKSTFVDDPTGQAKDYDGPIGRAELTWYISGVSDTGQPVVNTGLSSLRVGYQRDADISSISDFYQMDRAFAELSYNAGNVFLLNLGGGVAFVNQARPEGDPRGGDLNEIRPEARLFAEYRLTSSIAIFTNNSFTASAKHQRYSTKAGTEDDLYFVRLMALLGVRWFM
jgi:hypothetical protein